MSSTIPGSTAQNPRLTCPHGTGCPQSVPAAPSVVGAHRDHERMPAFHLPLSVQIDDRLVDLVVGAPGPVRWSEVAPQIADAAGLPAATPLFLATAVPADDAVFGRPPLLAGIRLSTRPTEVGTVAGILALDCVAGPDAGRSAAVHHRPLSIGRSAAADLTLVDPEVSLRHALLSVGAAGTTITDLQSTNGIRVGDRRCRAGEPQPLAVGELVRVGGSLLRLELPAGSPMLRHPDGAGRWQLGLPARTPTRFGHPLPAPPGPAPDRGRRPIPIAASLAAAVAGATIALLTGLWMFLLMAALGPVTMIATAVGDRISGRRPHRRAVAEHTAATVSYRQAVAAAAAADRADAWERFADPARLLRWAAAGGVRLWEHRSAPSGDPAGFELLLSIGSRPARFDAPGRTVVTDVPLPTELPRSGVLGLCGRRRGTLRWLLAQLVGGLPPDQLQLQILSAADDLAALRDVPHTRDGDEPGRIHRDSGSLIGALGRAAPAGRLIVVLDGAERWRDDRAVQRLLDRTDPRMLVIVIARSPTALPVQCESVVELDRLPGESIGISPGYLADLAAALAPLSVGAGAAGLPREVSAPVPDLERLAARWQRDDAPRIELGTGVGGPLHFDLAADGPHLLIAGTTGSGKSELLQTLIAGLAEALSPERLALLLLDYKGGAAFADAARLPHTTGIVTDLDPRLAARALASLQAEIRSRERLLARAGAAELTALQGSGRTDVPPRLVIVVDEFATLAAELPQFLTGLVDIAQRGRSLGLHLILATQRPAGVVGPAIKANTAARICLRVTDAADSLDVIDSPLAAAITADLPGRGQLRTAGGRLAAFQTRRVTAASAHRVTVRARDAAPAPATGPVPLAELIRLSNELASGLRRPAPPWLPALPERIRLTDPTLLGLLDLPAQQDQRPWRLPADSLLICGPARSGRTAAGRRWLQALAADGGELLVVDGGGGLTDLAAHPAVTTYLTVADPSLVLRLLELLTAEAAGRSGGQGIGLLLDGWEPLAAALDLLDFGQWQLRIAELAGRGPAAGIRLAVTGGPRLDQHRLAQAFGSRLLLGLPNNFGEPTPGTPPGRGRLAGTVASVGTAAPAGAVAAEVQLAEPTDRWPTNSWPADRGPADRSRPARRFIVRPLPDRVCCSTMPAPTAAAVPIGVGGDAAAPVGVDLTGAGGGWLVAGQRRSGVSGVLAVLAAGAAAAGIHTVRVTIRPTASLPGVRDIDLRAGPDPLRSFLAGHTGPLLLVGDNAEELTDQPAAELLLRFLAVAGAGQYLALGTRLDRALRSHRGPIAETAAFRTGVLLGADAMDGIVLDTVLPKRRTPAAAGRGHLITAGVAVALQVATAEPSA